MLAVVVCSILSWENSLKSSMTRGIVPVILSEAADGDLCVDCRFLPTPSFPPLFSLPVSSVGSSSSSVLGPWSSVWHLPLGFVLPS
ncbi:hypothetical protein V6N13_081529 [Hibiscus sabdariffa]